MGIAHKAVTRLLAFEAAVLISRHYGRITQKGPMKMKAAGQMSRCYSWLSPRCISVDVCVQVLCHFS